MSVQRPTILALFGHTEKSPLDQIAVNRLGNAALQDLKHNPSQEINDSAARASTRSSKCSGPSTSIPASPHNPLNGQTREGPRVVNIREAFERLQTLGRPKPDTQDSLHCPLQEDTVGIPTINTGVYSRSVSAPSRLFILFCCRLTFPSHCGCFWICVICVHDALRAVPYSIWALVQASQFSASGTR